MTTKGVDYSFSRPNPSQLYAAGYRFAVRYLTGAGKAIDRPELSALLNAGLRVAVVFEGGEANALDGATQGRIDGQRANDAADLLGFPRDRPIYYAVDFDDRGHPGCLPTITAYLNAAQDGRREARVYGSIRVVDHIGKPGWQTAAWSGHDVSPRAVIYQNRFQLPFHGSSIDENEARAVDYGQHPAPKPVAPPAPLPPPVTISIPEDHMHQSDIPMRLDTHGNGYVDIPGVKAVDVRSVLVIGPPDPAQVGSYPTVPNVALTIAHDTRVARVIVTGGVPGGPATVRVIHA